MLENLAPAGGPEALERAIAAGADAVYLGYSAFSARAGAGNFDEEQLRQAVALCHLHHVCVHVTVNTLIKDSELDAVLEVLRLLNELRVDAVLVQDLGVLSLIRACLPGLPVHASTQMALHNAAGVRFAKRCGITRAVLARECSLREIALCAAEGIELEAFGHGAQCVAVSGECLFSSMLGERSGNRGRCAQPCRLPYTYQGRQGAWLSPRDVCLRDHLDALERAGVCSVKLEGRLKRPEYVAVVANSYRRGIDSLQNGSFRPADAEENEGLRQIFQRGGFMRGYALGAEDADVICPERVNHSGIPLGEITDVRNGFARCRVEKPLHNGDSLQLRTARGDAEMIYSGPEVQPGGIATLRLREDMRPKAGDAVIRLVDALQLEQARAMERPGIPVTLWLEAMPGTVLSLTASDGISHVTVTGDTVAAARSRSMTEEDAARSLGKTGDTDFTAESIHVRTEGAFVPVSALNALRRAALKRLAAARCEAFAHAKSEWIPPQACVLPRQKAEPMVIFRHREQLGLVSGLTMEPVRLCWYPEDWREDALERDLAALPEGIWLQLPTVCEQATLERLQAFAARHRDRLGGLVLGSVGQLGSEWPLPYGAGAGIPVMNRRAAAFLLEQGCAFVTASCELTGRELQTLMTGEPPILVQGWGRAQMMLLHHCPARTLLGLNHGHADCTMCDREAEGALKGTALTDRRGYRYPLLRQRLPEGCLVRLMNALPTDLRREAAAWPLLYELTTEQTPADLETETTSGHWSRAVE